MKKIIFKSQIIKSQTINSTVLITTLSLDILILASALIRAWTKNVSPKRYFDDGGYVSWFSFLQILVAAYFAWNIFKSRQAIIKNLSPQKSHNIWLVLSLGFLFLSFDELLALHEKTDKLIHYFFKIQETNLTDRIDSLIVLIYAILGLVILYWAKYELRKFKAVLPLFILGMSLTFMMILLDLLTDSHDFVNLLFSESANPKMLNQYISIVEECLKIFAEGIFIVALHRCLRISRTMNRPI